MLILQDRCDDSNFFVLLGLGSGVHLSGASKSARYLFKQFTATGSSIKFLLQASSQFLTQTLHIDSGRGLFSFISLTASRFFPSDVNAI